MIDVTRCASRSVPPDGEFVVKLPFFLWKSPYGAVLYRVMRSSVYEVWRTDIPVVAVARAYESPDVVFAVSQDGIIYRYCNSSGEPGVVGVLGDIEKIAPRIEIVAKQRMPCVWYSLHGHVYAMMGGKTEEKEKGAIISEGLTITRNGQAVTRWEVQGSRKAQAAILDTEIDITTGNIIFDYAPYVLQWNHLCSTPPEKIFCAILSRMGMMGQLEVLCPTKTTCAFRARAVLGEGLTAVTTVVFGDMYSCNSVVGIYCYSPSPVYSYALPHTVRLAHVERDIINWGVYYYYVFSQFGETKAIHVFSSSLGYLTSFVLREDGSISPENFDCLREGNSLSEKMRREKSLPQVTEDEVTPQILAAALINPHQPQAERYLQHRDDFPQSVRLVVQWE